VAADGAMKTWKTYVAVNVGSLIWLGIFIFIAPPHTRLWLLATISAIFLAGMNSYLFMWLRVPALERKKIGTGKIVIWLGALFFLVDLVFRYFNR
jgi:hypothetical protein